MDVQGEDARIKLADGRVIAVKCVQLVKIDERGNAVGSAAARKLELERLTSEVDSGEAGEEPVTGSVEGVGEPDPAKATAEVATDPDLSGAVSTDAVDSDPEASEANSDQAEPPATETDRTEPADAPAETE